MYVSVADVLFVPGVTDIELSADESSFRSNPDDVVRINIEITINNIAFFMFSLP